MQTLTEARRRLERKKGERDVLIRQRESLRQRLTTLSQSEKDLEESRLIIQTVAKETQSQLQYHVSELVTLGLEAVFPDPYSLNLEFELKRGKSEAVLSFTRDGEESKVHPLSASGGGAVDVAAFGLRVALWSLRRPRSRKSIILDEPFRFLSRDLQPRASNMLKEISDKLGLQFIIVSHEEDLVENADRVFVVKQKKGVSHVKTE
jgi:ABC-type glutathione transport system ATPase component